MGPKTDILIGDKLCQNVFQSEHKQSRYLSFRGLDDKKAVVARKSRPSGE